MDKYSPFLADLLPPILVPHMGILLLWIFFIFFGLFFARKKKLFRGASEFFFDTGFVLINAFLFWEYWPALNEFVQKYIEIPQISLHHLSFFWQWLIVMVIIDFFKWWTHRSLHTFPLLWKMHKTHHRITQLYFLRVLRYNPLENVYYALTTLPPLLFLSFSVDIWPFLIFFEAFIGYMNHANTRLRIPNCIARVINTPQVHIWHHDESHPKHSAKNFGINLSLWDFIFGTLYLSNTDPKEIGVQ